jgi:glutamine kinase
MRSSKARTLDSLQHKLSKFTIPEFIYFESLDWRDRNEEILLQISRKFEGSLLAVRSSAANEDGINKSRAGEYESILNVPSRHNDDVVDAVEKVLTSYRRNGDDIDQDEVIVQRMLQNTIMSGVIFTHDLNTGAPYYVINYDDVSGKTNTVTSGDGKYANRTLYIHRGAADVIQSERFKNLIEAIQELEKIMDSQFLDVEFAVDKNLDPHLFQVRAITTQPNWNRAVSKRIDSALNGIQTFVRSKLKPIDGIYGRTTVLGQMPDWNPAEMIGRAPRRLAFSLYETFITNHAWRIARDKMGYAVPKGQPLMVSLAGQPFIDTRLSFHSYLPKTLSDSTSEKLVNTWINKLKENPELHDKVEFDVAITIFSFDIDEKIEKLAGNALNGDEKAEFKECLRNLTIDLVKGENEGGVDAALSKIKRLEEEQQSLNLNTDQPDLNALYKMIDDCIWLGTIPFSILARHGFIARTILLSLESKGILSKSEVQSIQSGIRTVASDLVSDMLNFQEKKISRKDFMLKYGHLRPGTYDILSLRYDQIENFGVGNIPMRSGLVSEEFTLNKKQTNSINEILKSEGFYDNGIDAGILIEYIKKATAGREYGKFIFTRTVSDILELIATYGENNGLSRDEISHVSFTDILKATTTSKEESIEDRLRKKSKEGAELHAVSSAIRLPQVLHDEKGVHVVPFQISHPNFITDKRVDAECIRLLPGNNPPSLTGKIVIIESADPGFDWIFAHDIAGLITKYGGANSHMAIRCAEFSIPAAIGCGEQKFEIIINTNKLLLDCATGLIQAQI